MKRLYLALALALFASAADARMTSVVVGGGVSVVTWSCDDATMFCESFDDDDGKDLSWNDTGTIGWQTANAGAFHCDGASVYMLEMNRDGTNISTYSNFTDASTAYGLLWFKLVSHSISVGVARAFVAFPSSADAARMAISFYNNAGDIKLRLTHRDQSAAAQIDDNTLTISNGTWYMIDWKWIGNQVSGGVSMSVTPEGGSPTATTIADGGSTVNGSVGRVLLEVTTSNYRYQVDNIKINGTAPSCD